MNWEELKAGDVVAAHVAASAYPRAHWRGPGKTSRCLIHAAKIVDPSAGTIKPICKKVGHLSLLPDAVTFNTRPVDCPECVARLARLGVTIAVQS